MAQSPWGGRKHGPRFGKRGYDGKYLMALDGLYQSSTFFDYGYRSIVSERPEPSGQAPQSLSLLG